MSVGLWQHQSIQIIFIVKSLVSSIKKGSTIAGYVPYSNMTSYFNGNKSN